MFGYIKAYKPELRIREYEQYKAVYCSLCKALGKQFSFFARFTLSYDFVFVTMMSLALSQNTPEVKRGRCAFNPMVRCNYIENCNESFSFSANTAALMLYYKAMDNLHDESFLKKISIYAVYPFLSHIRKKAAKIDPKTDELVKNYIEEQFKTETRSDISIDMAAHPTAKLLEQLFEQLSDDDEQKTSLRRLGYCLGRWVYFIDAADDLKRDKKDDNFNPFIDYEPESEEFKKYADCVLTMSAGEAHKAFAKLTIDKYKPILENILLLGLQSEQNRVLNKERQKN